MNNQPKISIVIPLYNVEPYITECLQSVARQTYKGDIECIIVDDCGTDDSVCNVKKFIRDYTGTIDFKLIHHEHNRGLSAARNTGTDAATGEYIYYLDSDDWIKDDCLEILQRPLRDNDYDIVMADLITVPDPQIRFLWLDESKIYNNREEIIKDYADRLLYVMVWNKLCSRDFLIKNDIRFPEIRMHEDDLWFYKVMEHIKALTVVYMPTYVYRIRENSLITNQNNYVEKVHSLFNIAMYVINNPIYDCLFSYSRRLVYYIDTYLNVAFEYNIQSFKKYLLLRKSLRGNVAFKEIFYRRDKKFVKSHFHLYLCPLLGFMWLKIRKLKNEVVFHYTSIQWSELYRSLPR